MAKTDPESSNEDSHPITQGLLHDSPSNSAGADAFLPDVDLVLGAPSVEAGDLPPDIVTFDATVIAKDAADAE